MAGHDEARKNGNKSIIVKYSHIVKFGCTPLNRGVLFSYVTQLKGTTAARAVGVHGGNGLIFSFRGGHSYWQAHQQYMW